MSFFCASFVSFSKCATARVRFRGNTRCKTILKHTNFLRSLELLIQVLVSLFSSVLHRDGRVVLVAVLKFFQYHLLAGLSLI